MDVWGQFGCYKAGDKSMFLTCIIEIIKSINQSINLITVSLFTVSGIQMFFKFLSHPTASTLTNYRMERCSIN